MIGVSIRGQSVQCRLPSNLKWSKVIDTILSLANREALSLSPIAVEGLYGKRPQMVKVERIGMSEE